MLNFITYWQRPFLVQGTYFFIKLAYIYILYECSYPDVPAFGCMAAPPPSPHLLPPPTLLSKSAPGAVATSTMEVFPWTTGSPTTVSLHSGPALQSKPWLTRLTQGHGMILCAGSLDYMCCVSATSALSSAVQPPSSPGVARPVLRPQIPSLPPPLLSKDPNMPPILATSFYRWESIGIKQVGW